MPKELGRWPGPACWGVSFHGQWALLLALDCSLSSSPRTDPKQASGGSPVPGPRTAIGSRAQVPDCVWGWRPWLRPPGTGLSPQARALGLGVAHSILNAEGPKCFQCPQVRVSSMLLLPTTTWKDTSCLAPLALPSGPLPPGQRAARTNKATCPMGTEKAGGPPPMRTHS